MLNDAGESTNRDEGRTILVVDDEASMRELLKLLLETEGYRVLTAANSKT